MTDSILTSVKKAVNVGETDKSFDVDILLHLNSALAVLHQMGVGPRDGFEVEDESATWENFLGVDPRLNSAKTYVSLSVRMDFDPPATSFTQDAFKKRMEEIAWRLNVYIEARDAVPVVILPVGRVIDGGAP